MYDREVDPVTEQAHAMSVRALLVLLLLSTALSAEAREAREAEGDGTGCSSDYAGSAAPDSDPVPAARRQDTGKPAIPRGSGSGADASRPARWHSFLPGMIR